MRPLAWFLWMLLTLLPLHGWASAGMPLADEPVTASHGPRAEALPCPVHGAARAMAHAGQAVTEEQLASAAQAQAEADCSAGHASPPCGSCPSAAALSSPPISSATPAEQNALPVWLACGFAEADLRRFFRPPRS
jgi:hypothetical protein